MTALAPTRERYWTDVYAHEIDESNSLRRPAGLDERYSPGERCRQLRRSATPPKEEQRLLRDGARKFLRFGGPKHHDLMLMGDCGAFAYVDHPKPAYKPAEVVEFYTRRRVHAWRVARPRHLRVRTRQSPPPRSREDVVERFRDHAGQRAEFFELTASRGRCLLNPLGAVQGWSPESMAEAAERLVKMGYRYLAIGGLVPLKVDAIKAVLAGDP